MTFAHSCLLAVVCKALLLAVYSLAVSLAIFRPAHLSISSFGLGKYWVGKYSTERFSVTVPGGGCSQGCHG